MKKIITIILISFFTKTAFSKCAPRDISYYPSSKHISLNSIFIIEGYGLSQKFINSLENRTVYLESKCGEIVKLELEEFLKGKFNVSQVILKPNTKLKPHRTYVLKVSDETKDDIKELTTLNEKNNKQERISWKTTDKTQHKDILTESVFKHAKNRIYNYGCGDSIHAEFTIDKSKDSATHIWYKTELVNTKSNEKTTYYIQAIDKTLNVGHSMCYGAFTFEKNGIYKVRFTPINMEGKTLKTSKWISFKNPIN